jgi:hypothetical protein
MNKVERSEILALGAYEQIRDLFRARVVALKKLRRAQLGEHMSLVFENHDTMLLQVQEMLRTERISDEPGIAHELATYNELIPQAGGLSASLFIEYEDGAQRTEMLARFATLRRHIHLNLGSRRITAQFATHFGEEQDRLSAVNYLTFVAGRDAASALRDSSIEVSLEATHPDYAAVHVLSPPFRAQLANDLES